MRYIVFGVVVPNNMPHKPAGGAWCGLLGRRLKTLAAAIMVLLAAAHMLTPPASAQSNDAEVYTVAGIRVDKTAQSSAQARREALLEGQSLAYGELIQRIVTSDYLSQVPQLGASAVGKLVRSLDIEDEKITATRYSATLNVLFNADAVRNLMRANGVAYVDRISPPQLLIPMIIGEKGLEVAVPSSPWRAAWQSMEDTGFVPLLVPSYSRLNGNSDNFDAQIFLNQDQLAVNALSKRFRVSGALSAVLQADDNKGAAVVYVIGSSSAGKTDFRLAVQRSDLAPSLDGNESESFGAQRAASLQEAAQILATQVTNRLNSEWRRASATSSTRSGKKYQVGLRFDSFGGWDSLRSSIAKFPGLSEFAVEGLSTRGAVISFRYSAGFNRLRTLFARLSLILEQAENPPRLLEDFWVARRAGAPRGARQ